MTTLKGKDILWADQFSIDEIDLIIRKVERFEGMVKPVED